MSEQMSLVQVFQDRPACRFSSQRLSYTDSHRRQASGRHQELPNIVGFPLEDLGGKVAKNRVAACRRARKWLIAFAIALEDKRQPRRPATALLVEQLDLITAAERTFGLGNQAGFLECELQIVPIHQLD